MRKKRWLIILALVALGALFYTAPWSGLAQGPEPGELQPAPRRPLPSRPPPVVDGHGTGFIPPPMDLSHLTGRRMPEVAAMALPSSWDWREQGKVTSVKDQGACGSCYAFAALANIESELLIDGAATLPDPDFSENNAKECNWYDTSCSGGNYDILANLFSQKGTVLESCDQYVASNVSCSTACLYQKTLLDWRIISGNVVPDINVLKAYILAAASPIYTAMYASFPGFSTYTGTTTLYYAGTEPPDHAVLIVGWDDSLIHAGGTGGWIVKNSWGTDWGDEGYFYITYGSANIGMYSSFIYEWQDYDSEGGLMYYDEGGWANSWRCTGSTTAWGLAKFMPSRDTYVTRVEFWTTDATTGIDIYLYDDFDGAILSNLLRSQLNNAFAEAGYHSAELVSPLLVREGNDVIVVVKFANATSGSYPIATDMYGPYETGRTYIGCSGPGDAWYDMGTLYGEDVAIRLRTSGSPSKTYVPLIMKKYSP